MIGIGLVGYGYWGPNLARCFAETEDCRVIAIADPARDALARASRRHPLAKMTIDWTEIIADPRIDAVVIATPAETHFEIASAALRAGRHVLVEKPMADNPARARELIDLSERARLTLMVGYTFVYSSAARKIKELVLSRDLGKVQYYDSVRVNLGIGRHGVSVLADLAVHDLAILRYTLPSAPIAISANGVRFDHDAPESMAHVTTYLDDGAVAHLNVNWLAPVKTRRVTIGGTQKLLLWDDLEQSEKIKVYHCRPILMGDPVELREALIDYRIGDMWAPHLAPTEPLMNEVAHFRDCVTGNSTPITNGHFGLQIVDLIDAARLSMQQRGRPIELSAHCSARATLVASGG